MLLVVCNGVLPTSENMAVYTDLCPRGMVTRSRVFFLFFNPSHDIDIRY